MRWATRPGCHVDRCARASLIRRFIDSSATFVFVDDPDDIPPDATGFDIRDVALTHRRSDCSFETFLKQFELQDDALQAIARVVHEADLEDDRFDAPEARGLDAMVRGLSLLCGDDDELLGATGGLFDALYAYWSRVAVATPE